MLKVTVSEKKSSVYPVQVTKFDKVELQLQVDTDMTWDNPSFELLAIKPDGNAVRQTDNYTIIDKNKHTILFNLKEQFNTIEGTTKVQLVTKDNGRQSTAIFGLVVSPSLDSNILESHRDVKVLDDLETYIAQGREVIAESEEIVTNLKSEMSEFNEDAKSSESERQANELNRASKELIRIDNEEDRVANETERIDNEEIRVANENERKKKFESWEGREITRLKSEENRIVQEQGRIANEEERQRQEQTRQTQEQQRVQNEQGRIDRFNQEIERAEASINEVKTNATADINSTKSKAEAAITEATNNAIRAIETTTANADEIINEAESTMRGIEDRAEACLPLIEDSATAKIDYMGNEHKSIKDARDADVDWLLGEINTAHYDGQHITATNTIEGRSKSAILKGQTLVNLIVNKEQYVGRSGDINIDIIGNTVKPNTNYTLLFDVEGDTSSTFTYGFLKESQWLSGYFITNVGKSKVLLNTGATVIDKPIQLRLRTNQSVINRLVLLEGDCTNVDIPYFDGIQSVKMPVLTTTGKNLFALPSTNEMKDATIGKYIKLKLKANTNYTYNVRLDKKGNTNSRDFYGWISSKIDDNFTENTLFHWNINRSYSKTFNTGDNNWYLHIYGEENGEDYREYLLDFQIEQGSTATTYEPYKSNILTVNEDVTLRSNGDICDELNLLTGQLTQRIGEDGVVLSQEVVKTVDLSDSVVYSYKDTTHYTCSSEDGSLIPTLSIDVPTNLPALVSKQRATIESQKEQIATLETENEQLIAQNELQDVEIALNQDAINFILFQAMNMNQKTKGVNMMAAYFANQILKGKLDYALVVSRYPEYKEDIDTILIAEGKQDLIK